MTMTSGELERFERLQERVAELERIVALYREETHKVVEEFRHEDVTELDRVRFVPLGFERLPHWSRRHG